MMSKMELAVRILVRRESSREFKSVNDIPLDAQLDDLVEDSHRRLALTLQLEDLLGRAELNWDNVRTVREAVAFLERDGRGGEA